MGFFYVSKVFKGVFMINVKTSFFLDWPYDDAILWMHHAKSLVDTDPSRILLACGSHKETVITLGRHSLLSDLGLLTLNNCMVRKIDRGGGITAHQPGQIVLYPVINLKHHTLAVPQLVGIMEDAMMDFLEDLGIHCNRSSVGPGIFIDQAKIGFVGLRIGDHVTSHGLAVNILNDTQIFGHFDPCGIKALAITSAHLHAKLSLPITSYMELLVNQFLRLLKLTLMRANQDRHQF